MEANLRQLTPHRNYLSLHATYHRREKLYETVTTKQLKHRKSLPHQENQYNLFICSYTDKNDFSVA